MIILLSVALNQFAIWLKDSKEHKYMVNIQEKIKVKIDKAMRIRKMEVEVENRE